MVVYTAVKTKTRFSSASLPSLVWWRAHAINRRHTPGTNFSASFHKHMQGTHNKNGAFGHTSSRYFDRCVARCFRSRRSIANRLQKQKFVRGCVWSIPCVLYKYAYGMTRLRRDKRGTLTDLEAVLRPEEGGSVAERCTSLEKIESNHETVDKRLGGNAD